MIKQQMIELIDFLYALLEEDLDTEKKNKIKFFASELNRKYTSKKKGLSIEQVHEAISLYKLGMSSPNICVKMKLPKSSVYDAIRNNLSIEEFNKYRDIAKEKRMEQKAKLKKEFKKQEKTEVKKYEELRSKWVNVTD